LEFRVQIADVQCSGSPVSGRPVAALSLFTMHTADPRRIKKGEIPCVKRKRGDRLANVFPYVLDYSAGDKAKFFVV